jgi:starch phosphorylase
MVFLPNYDINVSRMMVAGCDVWLNTPRRPREASGTSGMKAAMNGLPNLSVLDGWWDESDYVRTGWPIGHGENYDDPTYQDDVEANALYDLLEQEVVPLFYDRDDEGLPRGWIAKMKDAIRLNCPHFNTARMLSEYATRGYFPSSDRYYTMIDNEYAPAKELAHWQTSLFEHWYDMRIEDIKISELGDVQVGQVISVKARINLGTLSPKDVQVELYKGSVNADGDIADGNPVVMDYQGQDPQTPHVSIYTVDVAYAASGLQGLSLRVMPNHEHLSSPYAPRLILWA